MKKGILSVLGFSTLIIAAGCAAPRERVVVGRPAPVVRERVRARVIVRQTPPPPIEEVIPRSPGPRYVWVPGYWIWQDRWLWQSGQWEAPPRERAAYQPGRWVEDRRGEWFWEPGHWH